MEYGETSVKHPIKQIFYTSHGTKKKKKEDLMENCALDNNDVGEKGKS